MSMQVIKPVAVTDAMLISTDVPETDHAEWSAVTTYALGDRVILAATHKIYESLQAGNLDKAPATQTAWWIEVSPTNRWKAFDLSNSTQTAQADAMYFEIEPGQACNAVSILNCAGVNSVRYRVTDPSFGLIYDETYTLTTIPSESSWYAWFFSDRIEQEQNIDLSLPSYPNAVIRIDLTGASTMAVGVILLGQARMIGNTVYAGATVGIQDYSRKERNDYGDTILVERAFAKRASFTIFLENRQLDNVQTLLASVRATPCLWIGSNQYNAATVFGFYKEFDISITYSDYSECSIELEGLT